MIIYSSSFILSVFSELDQLLVKDTRKINLRRLSKWRRSLNLSMACDACGNGGGDPTRCRCIKEEEGVDDAGIGASMPLNVPSGVLYPGSNSDGTLPPFADLLPPGEVPQGAARAVTAVPPGYEPCGYRPVGPRYFGSHGMGPRAEGPGVVVYGLPGHTGWRHPLVDASGRSFCGGNGHMGCEKPMMHDGRCGQWAVCVECGITYGAEHLDSCPLRDNGLEIDKPPGMCQKRPFCELPAGHRRLHMRAPPSRERREQWAAVHGDLFPYPEGYMRDTYPRGYLPP